MEKIKIAQIGVSHEHAVDKFQALEALSDIYEIAGVVNDLDFNHTPRYIDDVHECFKNYKFMTLDEVLNDPEIKAVTVEVPNNELVPIALKCAEKGIAMHMDKPAGLDLALYKKLLDTCKANRVPFQIGYMLRVNHACKFCIKAIREKWIGDVITIEADMNHGYGAERYLEYISQFSGGVMYNLGCHLIDFITAAMGRPEKVKSFLRPAPGNPPNSSTNCLAVLEYPNAYAVVKVCSRHGLGSRAIRIVGTNGLITLSPIEKFGNPPVELDMTIVQDQGYPAGKHHILLPPLVNRYADQLRELAQVIRKETTPTYSFEHDLLVHEITLAASGYIDWKD